MSKKMTIQSVVDDIQSENDDIEVRFLEDGSVQLLKNGEIAGLITEEE